MRMISFVKDEYYHIFNRGVDKRKIILDKQDLYYFLDNLSICNTNIFLNKHSRKDDKIKSKNSSDLVHIVAFAIMPNHFHLLLREIQEGGISKFMHKVCTSYSKYFNKKYDRSGSLFEGRFKATYVSNPVAVSAYNNLNDRHHKLNKDKDLYRTSYAEFIKPETVTDRICNDSEVKEVISMAGGLKKYINTSYDWSEVFIRNHEH